MLAWKSNVRWTMQWCTLIVLFFHAIGSPRPFFHCHADESSAGNGIRAAQSLDQHLARSHVGSAPSDHHWHLHWVFGQTSNGLQPESDIASSTSMLIGQNSSSQAQAISKVVHGMHATIHHSAPPWIYAELWIPSNEVLPWDTLLPNASHAGSPLRC